MSATPRPPAESSTNDPETSEPIDLAAVAADKHVVVIGGGISGLVAARECAKVGMRVTVLEAADAVGGAIRRAELDGVIVDAGAESYATRGGHVRALLHDLGLTERIVTPAAGGAWLAGIPGAGAAPLPAGGLLGIPGNPFQEDVRRIIGWSGVWRAYLDRLRPPLTIGHVHSLGHLVTSRMGARVRDRLVAPVTMGVYSAAPEDIDVEIAAPGLNAALTTVGSLSGAVQSLRGEAASRSSTPGAAVEGIAGGMSVLIDALVADIEKLGGVVRRGVAVSAISGGTQDGQDQFLVTARGATDSTTADDGTPIVVADVAADVVADVSADGDVAAGLESFELPADGVIVATAERPARELLAAIVPELAETESSGAPEIELVTLVLAPKALSGAPRGTGVLTVPGSHTAKALTHSTAKWEWLAEAAGDRHVVRVSFGAQGERAATAELDDTAATALAVREASALLGVTISDDDVLASHRSRFVQSQPASVIGSESRRGSARSAVQKVHGVAAVGAWLAGTGLAQVVPDASAESDRLRHALLWA